MAMSTSSSQNRMELERMAPVGAKMGGGERVGEGEQQAKQEQDHSVTTVQQECRISVTMVQQQCNNSATTV
jgi:hypothetical protein